MNSLTLIGEVVGEPVYHCGTRAQDIVRIRLRTLDRNGGKHVHHCVGFGPAAIDLHTHLKPGEQLLVRGELLYRKRMVDGDMMSLPIHLAARLLLLRYVRPSSGYTISRSRESARFWRILTTRLINNPASIEMVPHQKRLMPGNSIACRVM